MLMDTKGKERVIKQRNWGTKNWKIISKEKKKKKDEKWKRFKKKGTLLVEKEAMELIFKKENSNGI